MIEINQLNKTYPGTRRNSCTEVFRDFSIEIPTGQVTTILGGNGSGKTTLFLILAGVLPFDSGSISFNRQKLDQIKKSFVFQDYKRALFPWYTVQENIAMPLIESGVNRSQAYKAVEDFIACHDLTILYPYLNCYPYQLSGGLAQNVSIARALISEPDLLLLDEPFAALDIDQRLQMENRFLKIARETDITALFISHDMDEAVFLGQSCLILPQKPVSRGLMISSRLPSDRIQSIKSTSLYGEMRRIVYDRFYECLDGKELSSIEISN